MNYHSFRYFIEVANTLSFTKASQNLFVSQPGISQQIHLLEERLGIKLLHRTTRKVELTEEGKYLYKKLNPLFSRIENTVSNLVESNKFPTLIKIVTIPSAASLYLPRVLKEVHEIHPEIEFSIKETTSSNVIKLIKSREYHLGFIRTPADAQLEVEKNLDYLEFKRSPIKVVVSTKHQLADREIIKLDELKNEYILHYDAIQSPALYHLLENAFKHAGFSPKTVCTGPDLLTIANLVSNNLGVTLMPNDMFELISSPEIRALDLEDIRLESSIAAIWEDNVYQNLNTKLLIRTLSKVGASLVKT